MAHFDDETNPRLYTVDDNEPTSPGINPFRARVALAAESQVGRHDPVPYWRDVLPLDWHGPFPPAWCGAFALWSLHQANLARDWQWHVGSGFLYRLQQIRAPEVGDIAYFAHHQHHAVIVGVASELELELVNGNGADGYVTRSKLVRPQWPGWPGAFYSIATLLEVSP